MARCKNCYLEIQPGDKNCRRCHLPVNEHPLLNWRTALIVLGCAALIGGATFFYLRH
jgi:hypothetical protein